MNAFRKTEERREVNVNFATPQCSSGVPQSRPFPARAVKRVESAGHQKDRGAKRGLHSELEDESPEPSEERDSRRDGTNLRHGEKRHRYHVTAGTARSAVALVPPVNSSLVGKQKWGRTVLPCWSCGYSPVRLEVTRDDGSKQFAYTCHNEECEKRWQSPPEKLWARSKSGAAAVWDMENNR